MLLHISHLSLFCSVLYCRYDAPLAMCKAQDYIFQLGQMLCTATITVVNAYVFFVLFTKTFPIEKKFNIIYLCVIALCFVLVITAIIGDTADLFCGSGNNSSFSSDTFDDGTISQKNIIKVAYLYPLVMMLVINILFSGYCVFQMAFRSQGNELMLPLLKRLLTFTMVVLVCGLPKSISFFFFDDHNLFGNISNCFIHLSGVFISASYFYYAIVKDKKRWDSRSLLNHNNFQSSTPVGAYEDSEFDKRSSSSTMPSFDMKSLSCLTAGTINSISSVSASARVSVSATDTPKHNDV
jgi:hypothetical protein